LRGVLREVVEIFSLHIDSFFEVFKVQVIEGFVEVDDT
jgi:hypothetical protein